MKNVYLFLLLSIVSSQLFAQNYTVLGSSSQSGSCHSYQLTPNSGGQAGAIFQNQTINMNNSFDFTFNNFFGCNGSSGADGEAFVLTTNPNGLGNQGEGLGYGGPNQPCSFAIEFDTWQNGNHGDPGYDHTAFESGGSVDHNVFGPVAALPSQGNLDDCQWHLIHIIWDVNTNTLSLYIDGNLRISQVYPNFINNYLCGNPNVNWGWSGSTGGGWNLQQVQVLSTSNWVAGNNYQSCTPTIQFTDISTSNIGALNSWRWTFGDGGTSTSQNPLHTYASQGVYNATLITVDASGCADTFSHAVTIGSPITLTASPTDPPCNGGLNGSIGITPAGGFGVAAGHGGYSYSWNNGNTQQTNAGIGAGTYTVTVTDGVCTATGQYTLGQPTALSASTSSTAASCGLNNGTCTIVISGGTQPYTGVSFAGTTATGGPNTYTAGGFLGGTYIANFHDARGCSALLQYTATVSTAPCGITSSTSTTNVTCFGGNTGTATLNVSGGGMAPPSTITWTRGGSPAGTGSTISNLVAGTYNYTYTDQNGANTFTGSVNITQPGAPFLATLATSNVSCAGSTNGQAVTSVSGGIAPFHYQWSGGQPDNPVASNLGQGSITVTVSDATGCSATASGTISSAPALTLNIVAVNNACNQVNSGSAAANVTGGTPPYQYTWSNIASGQTDLNLGAGSYTVTVTDSASCTITGSTTISSSPPLLNTVSSTNISCHGDSTGTITVTTSGGRLPYNYSWSSDSTGTANPNLTGANLTTLKAGEYLLTVTDAGGCLYADTIIILQPATGLSVTTTHGNVTCFGANNGYVAIAASNGIAPYTFNGQTVPANGLDTAKNLSPGNYSGTVADGNGCSVVVTANITSPLASSLTITHVDNTCNGTSAGSATANFVNATGTVIYQWSNSQTGSTISNLAANTYDVTATDANSCVLTGSAVISQPPAISLQIAQTNNSCFGATVGSITITTSGGMGPAYTYNWNPNVSSTNTASALAAGPYAITVTDQNLCTKDTLVTITQPAQPLTATYQVTDVACFGNNTGSITITPINGALPYSYTWNPSSASSSNVASNLLAGSYDVTISDVNGCSITSTQNVAQPAAALSVTASQTDLTCFGISTGAANVVATGGTSPYTYTWTGNTNSSTASATNLSAGNYSVLVSDNHSCTATQAYVIVEPTAISLQITQTNNSCFGATVGSITITTSGGTGPAYTYNWNPNVSSTNTASALAAGPYAITITDQNLCTKDTVVTITQPAQPLTATYQVTDVACFGNNTGSITITPSNGGLPYSYTWNPSSASSSNVASNLLAGSYDVTISDVNGCSITSTQNVAQPAAALSVTSSQTDLTCFGINNGIANVVASGGTSPYTYTWTGNTTSTSSSATNLPAGNYSVLVSDNHNCTATQAYVLTQPPSITLQIAQTNNNCYGGTVGSITITASNGAGGPYTYNWSPNVSSTNSASNLAAGAYSITVKDQNLCPIDSVVTITQPALPLTATYQVTDVACFGNNTGSIIITPSNGVIPYSYTWNPSSASSSNSANNLIAGTYDVTISDVNGCSITSTKNIVQPAAALSLTPSHTDLTCFGSNDGTATAAITGGTNPYTYAWTGNTTGTASTATALQVGNYSVLVSDNHNCTVSQAYVIGQPPAINVISSQSNPLCSNTPTGSITYTVTGGTGTFTYAWSPNVSTSNTASNIVAGTYQTTMTDASGCSVTKSTTLTSPAAITTASQTTNVSCFGLTDGTIRTFPTGGTPGYTYILSDGINSQNSGTGQFTSLAANSYSIIVTDQNGCKDTSAAVVTQPTKITDNISTTAITCSNAANGQVVVQATGGTGAYNFSLTGQPNNSTGTFAGLQPGIYYTTVTDANNCTVIDSATVTQPAPLVLASNVQQPSCASLASNGKISINTVGGTVPYSFTWSKGGTDSIAQNLSPGSYHLTVTDNAGCTIQDSFTLAYLYSFTVSASPLDSILMGESDTLRYTLSGNAGNHTSVWTDDATLSCGTCDSTFAQPFVTTIYGITITNDSGCTAFAYDTVVVVPHYSLFVPNAFSANGDGVNDYFSVYGNLNTIRTFDLKIYNRWGEIVYETADANFKWDGTYKGANAQVGEYVYAVSVVYLDGNAPYIKKGSFVLLR